MILSKIKKMPVSLSYSDFKTTKNEFLVPFYRMEKALGFMGIKSGESFPFGAISYIGKEITNKDILEKIAVAGINIVEERGFLEYVGKFLLKLGVFRIGNILRVEYLPNDEFELIKVAESPPRERNRKLP